MITQITCISKVWIWMGEKNNDDIRKNRYITTAYVYSSSAIDHCTERQSNRNLHVPNTISHSLKGKVSSNLYRFSTEWEAKGLCNEWLWKQGDDGSDEHVWVPLLDDDHLAEINVNSCHGYQITLIQGNSSNIFSNKSRYVDIWTSIKGAKWF